MTSVNNFLMNNISSIGSALVLYNVLSFGAASLLLDGQADHDSERITSEVLFRNFVCLAILPVLFQCHSFAVSLLVIPLAMVVSVLTTSHTSLFLPYVLPISIILYFINVANKKRFLLHVDLEDMKCALVVAEEENVRIAAQTTDMHHMIGKQYCNCTVTVVLD